MICTSFLHHHTAHCSARAHTHKQTNKQRVRELNQENKKKKKRWPLIWPRKTGKGEVGGGGLTVEETEDWFLHLSGGNKKDMEREETPKPDTVTR